ncbi:MAG: response regulator [Opitutaceae bacterium]|nr:response regulator [Opitutaceae bacterium]
MSKTILHLDDEADIRDLLSAFLIGKGYRVISASTLHEALDIVAHQPVDLLITDLQLDEADGLETIRRIREKCPDTPVIILTGVLVGPALAQETLGQEVACYLEKTTPLAKIHAQVQRVLGE